MLVVKPQKRQHGGGTAVRTDVRSRPTTLLSPKANRFHTFIGPLTPYKTNWLGFRLVRYSKMYVRLGVMTGRAQVEIS
jgi:hypothetical protein